MLKKLLIIWTFIWPSLVAAQSGSPTAGGNVNFEYERIGKLNAIYTVSPPILIGRVINGILGILGTVALLVIIYAGFNWLTARGNDTKVRESISTMLWATGGLILIFGAYVVVRFMLELAGK